MKNLIYILIGSILLFSCEKYPEPGLETIERFQLHKLGNFQSTAAGSYLPVKVGAQIDMNHLAPQSGVSFRMEVAVTLGEGKVTEEIVPADPNGLMATKWQLGADGNKQELNCKVIDDDNKIYAEFTLEATAFFENKLNEVTTGYLVGIGDMVYDTIAQRTMMYSDRQIWLLQDKFYLWEPKAFPFAESIRFLDITSDGTVFAAGWRGSLYKSEDWGESWQYVCYPIPENEYFYNFNITSDDYLWATKNSFGVYCSKDKGLTWKIDTTERVKDSYLGPIYKYQDSYMTIADWPLSIVQKQNDSTTWEDINTPEYSLSMYIPNDSTIIAQNQGGFKLHKSTDNGQSFKQVFAPFTEMGGGDLWHVYNKFGNDYFVMAPSNGLWHTKDFEKFEQLIPISTYQSKVFIDHMGTIYASGWKFSNAEDEATYILPNFQ